GVAHGVEKNRAGLETDCFSVHRVVRLQRAIETRTDHLEDRRTVYESQCDRRKDQMRKRGPERRKITRDQAIEQIHAGYVIGRDIHDAQSSLGSRRPSKQAEEHENQHQSEPEIGQCTSEETVTERDFPYDRAEKPLA